MVSIVIPAYNEEKRIPLTLNKIVTYFENRNFEVIVVDDGSTDNTVEIVNSCGYADVNVISYKKNKGKGHAVKVGLAASKGNVVLLSDADLSTPIKEFPKLERYIKEYPVVIGSRAMSDSLVQNKWIKKFLGRFGNLFIRLILPDLRDTQCGFKLFRGDEVRSLVDKLSINGFGYDFELLFLAKKRKLRIKEVPVEWYNSLGTKVRYYHYLFTLKELFAVIWKNALGRYKN